MSYLSMSVENRNEAKDLRHHNSVSSRIVRFVRDLSVQLVQITLLRSVRNSHGFKNAIDLLLFTWNGLVHWFYKNYSIYKTYQFYYNLHFAGCL